MPSRGGIEVSGAISIDRKGSAYVCHNAEYGGDGGHADDMLGYNKSWYIGNKSGGIDPDEVFDLRTLEKKTLSDVEVGDVLIDGIGDERVALEVLTNSFLPSHTNNKTKTGAWYTFIEAEEKGWTLKDQEEEDDTVEVTIEEIAKLKGVDVDKIRIKKEDE